MTDQVLTDGEKEALLDGVATGEVEVSAKGGPQYSNVREFLFPERSRIVTNSFPRLQRLNHRLAGRLAKYVGQLLNTDVEIAGKGLDTSTYGEFCERDLGLALLVEFTANPLPGSALIRLEAPLVAKLVDSFFGGSAAEPKTQNPEFFTPGEVTVAGIFSEGLLGALCRIWQSFITIETERQLMHLSTDIVEVIDTVDEVISCDFEIVFLEQRYSFQLVWPKRMVASLLPVFEGQKRDRDPAEVARWEAALSDRVKDTNVSISSNVGQTSMTLGAVAELKAGDVIDISNPRRSIVQAHEVELLEGRFGIHDGRYAVEATRWLGPGYESGTASN